MRTGIGLRSIGRRGGPWLLVGRPRGRDERVGWNIPFYFHSSGIGRSNLPRLLLNAMGREPMIRSPLGLRLGGTRPLKQAVLEGVAAGARGFVIDALGELSPDRLGESGRREVRRLVRSADAVWIALGLPTRRPFDTLDQLEDRLARADRAFALAYDLGTDLVLVNVGPVPPPEPVADASGSETPPPTASSSLVTPGGLILPPDLAAASAQRQRAQTTPRGPSRREIFETAVTELARRADHRGVRLALETGAETGRTLAEFLQALPGPPVFADLNPVALLTRGLDPVTTTRELAGYVAHAHAGDAVGLGYAGHRLPANPRGTGFAPGVLDWEEYLGALEEIGYRGFLTVLPDHDDNALETFRAVLQRVRDF